MKLCRHEVRAARGEGGAEVRILSFPLQCNRGGGPAFGRLSARILGFALCACQCPHSGLRAVGVPVPAFWAPVVGVPVPAFWASQSGLARILRLPRVSVLWVPECWPLFWASGADCVGW